MNKIVEWAVRILGLSQNPIIQERFISAGVYGYTALNMDRNEVILNDSKDGSFYSKNAIVEKCKRQNISLEHVVIFPNGYMQKIQPVVTLKSVAVNRNRRRYYDDY